MFLVTHLCDFFRSANSDLFQFFSKRHCYLPRRILRVFSKRHCPFLSIFFEALVCLRSLEFFHRGSGVLLVFFLMLYVMHSAVFFRSACIQSLRFSEATLLFAVMHSASFLRSAIALLVRFFFFFLSNVVNVLAFFFFSFCYLVRMCLDVLARIGVCVHVYMCVCMCACVRVYICVMTDFTYHLT